MYLKQSPNIVRDDDVGSRRRGSKQTRQAFDPPGQNYESEKNFIYSSHFFIKKFLILVVYVCERGVEI